MRQSQKAQTVIEVAFIVIAIMGGLFLAWKYIVPAVGGYFKSLDDAVQTSENDPLKQSQPGTGLGPECVVSPWFSTGLCGGGCPTGGYTTKCPATEMLQERALTGAGCPTGIATEQCVPDESCCTCWSTTCNTSVLAPECCGQNVQDMAGNGTWPTGPAGNPELRNSCADGQARQERICGSVIPRLERQCIPDIGCNMACIGVPQTGTQWCTRTKMSVPNVPDNQRLITKGLNIVLVQGSRGESTSAQCTQNQDCQMHCVPGTFPSGAINCATCPAPESQVSEQCYCQDPSAGSGACLTGCSAGTGTNMTYCSQPETFAIYGECIYVAYTSGGAGGFFQVNGRINGNPDGWQCEGISSSWCNPRSGTTCNSVGLRTNVWCDAKPPQCPDGAIGPLVYEAPKATPSPGVTVYPCGQGLYPSMTGGSCRTVQVPGSSGFGIRWYRCNGSAGGAPQTCQGRYVGRYDVLATSGPSVYQMPFRCTNSAMFFASQVRSRFGSTTYTIAPSQISLERKSLSGSSTCLGGVVQGQTTTSLALNFIKYYNCSSGTRAGSPPICNTFYRGRLSSTPTGTRVYKFPAVGPSQTKICGRDDILTTESTCRTVVCDSREIGSRTQYYYYDCTGNCDAGGPFGGGSGQQESMDCSTTSFPVGYLHP